MNVFDLPIYRDQFQVYLEIINCLDKLLKSDTKHKILIEETYRTLIQIFPKLNSGYNFWAVKGKLKFYSEVRTTLSCLQIQLHFLSELNIMEKDYFDELNNSIRYLGGLIKKMEGLPNEK